MRGKISSVLGCGLSWLIELQERMDGIASSLATKARTLTPLRGRGDDNDGNDNDARLEEQDMPYLSCD